MMFLRFLSFWTTPLSLPRRPPLPRISSQLLELLLTSKRLLTRRRFVLVRVKHVTVATPSVVDLLSFTSPTTVSSKRSVTCQELSSVALTVSTSSSSLPVDTWDVSASGLRPPSMPSTPSTERKASPSLRTSWPTPTWLVSSTPMRSNLFSTLLSVPTRSSSARRTLLPPSRLLPSLILMLLPLVRVSRGPRLLVRTRRLLS
mmetsp:Transcript_10350/g.22819  ORF Transcript_10350/g.22819 Transcript_10350/m.22819 type:complete len:202 (-) Transcript_10350:206-811(-)